MKLLKKLIILLLLFIGAVFVWGRYGGEISGFKGVGGDKPKVTEEKPIKFAVFSDIHSDLANLKKALDMAKNGKVEFVIITGDLTTIGKKSELTQVKAVLDKSGIEYYAVPGNHDYWYSRQFKQDLFKEVFGQNYQSFRIENYMFILIDNGDIYSGIKESQRRWIEEEIKDCPKIYCFLFIHIPLNHPNSLYVMGESQEKVASQAALLAKSLAEKKVREVYAGHLHFSSSYDFDGMRTTIVGAIASDRNLQSPKFLEVAVQGGKIEKKEVFIQ